MNATLVLPTQLAEELAAHAALPVETAGVLLVGIARRAGQLRLLAREVHWVPDDQYAIREDDRLSIRSGGYTRALARAEKIGAIAIWVHTHPNGWPVNSRHDDVVDDELSTVFQVRTGQDLFASLVLSPRFDGGFDYSGRVYMAEGVIQVVRAWIVGSRLHLLSAYDVAEQEQAPRIYDRQIRAFGGDVQRLLSDLRVGVIGAGGTGSAVVEQLARLGVGDLLLVDPDVLEDTNVTRVYGSSPGLVGEPKAGVLARHVSQIAPQATVRALVGRSTDRQVAEVLTDRDIIFGCTDDNAGRLVLSRISSYYLTPVVDCGVLLSSASGTLSSIDGRVTVMSPGYACLVCRNRIDLLRATAEQLNPEEQRLRQDEGYAPELGRIEPAVVTFTTLIAGLAVNEMLERLLGYGPTPAPSEILLRAHEREISTNSRVPNPGHFCDHKEGRIGFGDCEPFLGTTWRTN